MNLKKVGGSASADSKATKATVDRELDLLRRQIAILEPDVIVGGIGNSGLWHLLLPDIEFIGCGFDIGVTRVDGIRVIDFYHPSYRVPRAMSYALLGRVFQSEIFCKVVRQECKIGGRILIGAPVGRRSARQPSVRHCQVN